MLLKRQLIFHSQTPANNVEVHDAMSQACLTVRTLNIKGLKYRHFWSILTRLCINVHHRNQNEVFPSTVRSKTTPTFYYFHVNCIGYKESAVTIYLIRSCDFSLPQRPTPQLLNYNFIPLIHCM